MPYTLGIDYGTNSVRAIVVNTADGRECGTCVFPYPSGTDGVLLDPRDHNLARQSPSDYITGLLQCVQGAVAHASSQDPEFHPSGVIGIGVDTTGSSPIPVDARNRPLALDPAWAGNLAAQCWLWKDHTSLEEAAAITELARLHRPGYVARCGNTYSSEWWWSKIWHCLRTSPEVFHAAHSWVELADFIPALLSGVTDPAQVRRGICPAGHKALYGEDWGGLPDTEFLALLDPHLAELRERLYRRAYDASQPAGSLCPEWSELLGLPAGIPVAIGMFDVHYGAIGAGVRPGVLVKTIGTSTCDCAVLPMADPVPEVPGLCGIVPGAILPRMLGVEAGQSAVGDIFKWWVERIGGGKAEAYEALEREAALLRPGQSGLIALDWNNGNRTILVDPNLTGLLLGQTLYTSQAEIYRALIEATAFGARRILERMREYGLPTDTIICCGGIAEKNALAMQIYADVTGCTIQVSRSAQTCALGAALVASVLAGPDQGGHPSIEEAQRAMTGVLPRQYVPDPGARATYEQIYSLYLDLHDSFGGVRQADLGGTMKTLLRLKQATNQRSPT